MNGAAAQRLASARTPHAVWCFTTGPSPAEDSGERVVERARGALIVWFIPAAREELNRLTYVGVVRPQRYAVTAPRTPNRRIQTTERTSSTGFVMFSTVMVPKATSHAAPATFDHVSRPGDGRNRKARPSTTAATALTMKTPSVTGSTMKNAMPAVLTPAMSHSTPAVRGRLMVPPRSQELIGGPDAPPTPAPPGSARRRGAAAVRRRHRGRGPERPWRAPA